MKVKTVSNNSIDDIRDSIAKGQLELRKKLQEDGGDYVRGLLDYIFEADEGITSVNWRQYTPYFNDGEPCTFTVWFEGFFAMEGIIPDDAGEYEDGYISTWYLKHCINKHHSPDQDYNIADELGLDVERAENIYHFIEDNNESSKFEMTMYDIGEMLYGNHVIIYLYRNGASATEYYEHD